MAKKVLTIILIIIILATVGALVAFLVIKDTPQGKSVTETVKNYFPFGKAPENTSADQVNNSGNSENVGNAETLTTAPIPRLRKISSSPVSGATTITSAKGTSTGATIRYMERATGNVYDTKTDSLVATRISNTTLPKIYDVLWAGSGNTVIARYLKEDSETIETLLAKLNTPQGTSTVGELKTVSGGWPINITDIAVSPAQTRVFYLALGDTGTNGFVVGTDGKSAQKIFSSPLNEWLVSWPKEDIVSLTTKASAKDAGFTYFLNTKTGALNNILSNIRGLTTLAGPDASRILYSESAGGGFRTYAYSVKDSAARPIITTLPEKCVWSKKETAVVYCGVPEIIPPGDYPDIWYQGLISFTDGIWKIDTQTGSTTIVAYLSELGVDGIDIIKPVLAEAGDYLLFINKNDSLLWGLRIAEK